MPFAVGVFNLHPPYVSHRQTAVMFMVLYFHIAADENIYCRFLSVQLVQLKL